FGVAQNLGIDRGTAQTYIERYFARYPGARRYMDETRARAKQIGYVETVFGRRLWLPELRSGAPVRRQAAERAAINAPMQGTAADLIKLAMIAVQNWLDQTRLQTKLIMQVHDELVLEVPEAELDLVKTELRSLMCSVAKLDVPLVVDIGVGANWDQAHWRWSAPNTLRMIAVPEATGSLRIFFSSSATIKYRPSRVLRVTYSSRSASSFFTRPTA